MPITENTFFYSHQLSNEDYHADPAIGSSGLKKFAECPAIYYAHYLAAEKIESEESKAMRIGSFAHLKLLEPQKYAAEIAISPEFAVVNKGKSNEAKKTMNRAHTDWANFEAEAYIAGKKAVLFSEHLQFEKMAAMIQAHPLASKMLIGGKEEMSFFAKDPETGLMLKARPDYLVKLNGFGTILVDYKTAAISLSTTKQSNHAFNLDRHIQASHHKRVAELATGGKIDEVVYITQMSTAPYLVRVFRMPAEAIQIGNDMCKEYLQGIAEAKQNDYWPGYPAEIEDYVMPRWMEYEFN